MNVINLCSLKCYDFLFCFHDLLITRLYAHKHILSTYLSLKLFHCSNSIQSPRFKKLYSHTHLMHKWKIAYEDHYSLHSNPLSSLGLYLVVDVDYNEHVGMS